MLKAEDQYEDKGYGISDMGGEEGGRSPSTQGLGGREAPVAGGSPSSNSDLPSANEAAPVRNERPKRFVYGEKKGN